jgi:tocopherol cyclase-like protein
VSAFTSDGTENRMRWDRRSTGFMEVWYATFNHPPSGSGIWLRYTLTSPRPQVGPAYCELWGCVFGLDGVPSFTGKTRYPIDRLGAPNGRDDGALVRIGDAWLSENHLEGELTHEGRSLAWSLDFEPADRCFQHLPASIRRRAEKRVSTVCSPNLSVPFSGAIKLDNELLELDGARGCQSHRWGAAHSQSWAWAHCSQFEEAGDFVFEGVAARASLGPLPVPTTTFLYLFYDGIDVELTDLKWALKAKSTYEMPMWSFTARNDEWKVAGAARVSPDRLMQLRYDDPDGSRRYCANSEIADLALEVYQREGSEWVGRGSLTAMRTAHLEFGRREPWADPPVAL